MTSTPVEGAVVAGGADVGTCVVATCPGVAGVGDVESCVVAATGPGKGEVVPVGVSGPAPEVHAATANASSRAAPRTVGTSLRLRTSPSWQWGAHRTQ
ncbi:MAG TPA: hypothetical protein VHM94_02065 [Acidimicrobiia bacterium]|nr:hypothetical protein [Acidimicrobiia bacterium]